MIKKILFVAATHGDEKLGVEVLGSFNENLKTKFESIIGNPEALQKNKRYIDSDLNRVFPGKKPATMRKEGRLKLLQ